ncbi:tRNA (adenosine(37)-N6)-threonylcarbamoyltransferase complex ATPase subunit type 1 TsaE [Dissulfuribacter thermophilus]|uniref:tRNA (adenosine(37)-N6)-threonylcarbamoyltransferase complex ATPase subunit type 1 TsaE n=1 Tax=Dissulfuribacter thermophilus TaxID=1156395 RepID=UPI00082EDA5A|nr:tRNA (adenosine(37)-N6)-threonylcarbamoyltransferase complex ATPase subunit type 1 TsaE [Dissulfuribacter thermophilus]
MRLTVLVKNLSQTRALGKCISKLLKKGDLILFTGDLGAGKTTLIRETLSNLGVDKRLVTSPTFSILHQYDGADMPIVHGDLYRIGEGGDLVETGLYDYIDQGTYLVMLEWAEFLEESARQDLAPLEIEISFPPLGDSDERIVEFRANMNSWEQRLILLKECLEKEGITIEGAGS